MPICDQCSSAVRNLRPHDWPQTEPKRGSQIHATLPRYQNLSDVECWICYKFFQWLDLEDPGILEIWRKQSLRVEFQAYGRIQIDKPQPGPDLGPFFFQIVPPGYTEDNLGCEVELNFITGEGIGLFPKSCFFSQVPWHP